MLQPLLRRGISTWFLLCSHQTQVIIAKGQKYTKTDNTNRKKGKATERNNINHTLQFEISFIAYNTIIVLSTQYPDCARNVGALGGLHL